MIKCWIKSPDGMPKIKEELTEEDESRRQRRRERNKVAATKCRNKKKAKTINLMKVVTHWVDLGPYGQKIGWVDLDFRSSTIPLGSRWLQ